MSKAGFQCFTPVTGTVNVGNWDQMPNLGIELGGVEVGCVTDAATGAITGKVFLVIEKSEDGLTTTSVLKAVDYATGSVIDPYVGPIDACVPPAAPQLQAVNLEEMCLRVDGVAQRVVPVAVFDQATGLFGAPVYLDEMGNAITGEVTAADPCECSCTGPCEEVVIEGEVANAFAIDPSLSANATKINLDDPAATNAYTDIAGPWTAADLAAVLNAAAGDAVPPVVPSGVDYSSTAWTSGVTTSGTEYVAVASGPVPTSLDLVSIPASIPVAVLS